MPIAQANVIYESAILLPPGQEGGVFAGIHDQFLGARFSISEAYDITAIGGHLIVDTGTIWGAILPLSSAIALPTATPETIESAALISALFSSSSTNSTDLRESVNVRLGAGHYALVFGSDGLFGSTGHGSAVRGQLALPGVSFVVRDPHDAGWLDVDHSAPRVPMRFVVEGHLAAQVPEPSAVLLLLSGLLIGIRVRRK